MPSNVTTNIAANIDADTWLPGGGRTVPDIPTYFANNAVFNVKDFGAVGNGTTDDRSVLNALAGSTIPADGGTMYFPIGTYRIGSNLTIPANVCVAFGMGAKLTIDTGVTVTLNGRLDVGSYQIFSGLGTVEFARESIGAVYPEWWYDGNGDWYDAILSAITSIPYFSGVPIKFIAQDYPVSKKIVVPNNGLEDAHALVFEGTGAGDGRRTSITFSGADGDAGGFDFGSCGSYVTMRNFQILALDAATSASGTGLNFGQSFYVTLENIWVAYFDIGIHLNGNSIYSYFKTVQCFYNYSFGLKAEAAALLNGVAFEACNWGQTTNGIGFHVSWSGSASVAFRNCYFEGNAAAGTVFTGQGPLNVTLDSCYWEQNGDIDLVVDSNYPTSSSLIEITNGYFDEDLEFSHVRIWLKRVRAIISNTRLYQTGLDEPPVFIYVPLPAQPSMAFNNEYDTATLTNSVGDTGWFIIDSKHPVVSYSSGVPSGLSSVKVGQFFYNTDPNTIPTLLGHVCTAPGAIGVSNPSITAATTNGSALAVPSDATAHSVIPGDYIRIAGVTFGGGSAAYAQVLSVSAAGFKLDATANQTVATGAVTYPPAQFTGAPTYEEGTWTPVFSGLNTPGSYTVTVVNDTAKYVRVGRQVTISVQFTLTINTAGAGAALVSGLPFAKPANEYAVGAVQVSGVLFPTNAKYLTVVPRADSAVSELIFRAVFDNASIANVQVTDFANGDAVSFTMTYFI